MAWFFVYNLHRFWAVVCLCCAKSSEGSICDTFRFGEMEIALLWLIDRRIILTHPFPKASPVVPHGISPCGLWFRHHCTSMSVSQEMSDLAGK
jgi:hypothetical protein